jgi:UDP-N-acetylmuramoyl-L-alanyl-D-glutamate--2,6-diaminopimelate ligase
MQHLSSHAAGISVRETLPEARLFRGRDLRVSACSSDSRRLRAGDLFIALVGAERDGHDFAAHAVEQGATAVLAERPLPLDVPVFVVDDTREAYGRICQALVGRPAQHLRVIGVTGTLGKTTTATLLAAALEAAQQDAGLVTTLGCFDGLDSSPVGPSPTPPQWADSLARMAANGCSHAVLEVPSQALAQRRVAGIGFDAAVLTPLRGARREIDGLPSNARTAAARLIERLNPGGFVVLHHDDAASRELLTQLDVPVITCGMNDGADVTAEVVERYLGEQTFLLSAGSDSIAVRTRMMGDHHVQNCLSAAAAMLALGYDLATLVRGLESVVRLSGRLEPIDCGQPFGVYVDAARSPDALVAALRTLRQVTPGRVICVYGAQGDCDRDMRPLLGRIVERHAALGIITSDNPAGEAPLAIAHDILDGYHRPHVAHVLPGRRAAIHFALSQAQSGDCVLIAGKGHENFQIVGESRHRCDDRIIARRWLEQRNNEEEEQRFSPRVISRLSQGLQP